MSSCFFGGERAHLDVPAEARSEPGLGNPAGEGLGELLVDGILHVDALDGDAELPRVGQAAQDGGVQGLLNVRVAGHDHGVLAAELGGVADEPPPTDLPEGLAGGGGAGEHEVIAALRDGGAHHPSGAGDHLEHVLREARPREQLQAGEQGEGGGGVRLGHHRVAGHDRGDGVGNTQGQGIVPRADLAHHALGVVVGVGLGEEGHGPQPAPRGEEPARAECVVPGVDGDVHDLVEGRGAVLARLELRDVHKEVAVA